MRVDNCDHGIETYLREIEKISALTPEQELELTEEIKKGSRAARALMITANLRLVVGIAQEYTGLGVPLQDLVSEGNVGLMKAVEEFNPSNGAKLCTYAQWWIRESIKSALATQAKIIQHPSHVVDQDSKMRRGSRGSNERLPDEGRPGGFNSHKAVASERASIEFSSSGIDSTTLDEFISDGEASGALNFLFDKSGGCDVHRLFEVLDERERRIIFQRFGFDGNEPKTLKEIAAQFGITRERTRQIQNVALEKLRRAARRSARSLQTYP
jgi:RNA polymerase primary sigma factor